MYICKYTYMCTCVYDQRTKKMKDRIRERPPAQKTRRTANGKTTRIDSHEGGGCIRGRGQVEKHAWGHDGEIPLRRSESSFRKRR